MTESSLENPVSYRFSVTFLTGGYAPNPLDIRFQSVSGISSKINTEQIKEGGENIFVHNIPTNMNYENLVLKRGLISGSELNLEFNAAMTSMQFFPGNVLVTSLDNENLPVNGAGWLFHKAFPVSWSVSELNAETSNIIIDTLELTYSKLQHLRY